MDTSFSLSQHPGAQAVDPVLQAEVNEGMGAVVWS